MKAKEEYDVLKFIEHNQVCYVSSECIKGCLLPRWLKYHPCLEKRELFEIIASITGQLGQIHRCRNHPCYRYMNPYCIVVSEDRKVSFLDMNAKENENHLTIVQRRTVREHFLPPDELYYQKESVTLDIYGLGRTIQYLLSETETEPALTKSEEIKFQKIISRCLKRHSKKSFQDVSEIQKIIPEYKQPKSEKRNRKKRIMLIVIAVFFCFAAKYINFSIRHQTDEKERISGRAQDLEEALNSEEELNMQLGRIYFLELCDYEKSKEYFSCVKENILAENLTVLADCMINGDQNYNLLEALQSAEKEIDQSQKLKEEEKVDYYQCILQGYSRIESEQGTKNVIRICEVCLKNVGEEKQGKILGYMASAYEKQEKYEEAATVYEQQLEKEHEETDREALYQKTASVYEISGNFQKTLELLGLGIEEFEQSIELRNEYIRVQFKDPTIERSVCVQNIKEQLKECPQLSNTEEFQKLMKEYGINVKGDKVWEKEDG